MVIAPAQPSPKPKPRIIVYIDGLNLYYGVLQQVPAEKWLEVKTRTLCKKAQRMRHPKHHRAARVGHPPGLLAGILAQEK